MTIEAGVGCWLATVRCHDEGTCFTVPFQHVMTLAQEVEAALMSGTVPLRPYESWRGKKQVSQKGGKKA